jgi:TetR/AcrR family transcriptional regulator, transcriptional repressor for nem operon
MISSAADLMYVRGINAVTLDDVRAATGTSKSQLYKHFPDGKPELVRAVLALRAEHILTREEQRLARLKSMSGLRRWRDALVQGAALQGGAYGCALGNMVVELADQDEQARTALSGHFATWEGLLVAGFQRMQAEGILPAVADPDALAIGLMAALQGGYLLAQADHDVAPMATALDMALAHIESLTSAPTRPKAVQVHAQPLTAAKLRSAMDAGAVVLDLRSADDFASAHLRGALNVGSPASMAADAAAVCDHDDTVAMIVYPGEDNAAARLAESGFSDVAGVYALRAGAAFPAKLADLVQSTQRTSPRELQALLADGAVTVIEVRGKDERAFGTIPKAIEIALPDLRRRMHVIPTDKPIVVHSAAGGRSSTAASLLRANGLADVSDLTGGFTQWEPGVRPTRSTTPRKTTTSLRRASATKR